MFVIERFDGAAWLREPLHDGYCYVPLFSEPEALAMARWLTARKNCAYRAARS